MTADGDTDRRDRQLLVIVGLLRGVLRRAESELTSRSRSHLISGDRDDPSSCRRSGQRCPDRVGSLGRTGAADRAPGRAGGANQSDPDRERWVTKQQLADHFGVTTRWIERQQRLGFPYLRMGGMNRYCVSEVEAWLRGRDAIASRDEAR